MKVSLFEEKLEFVKISDKVVFRFAKENPCKRELHWFKTINGRRSINCAGEGCPFCKAGIPKLSKYLFIVYEHMSGEVKILELPKQAISTLTSIVKNIGYEAAIKKDFVLTRRKNSNPYYTLVTLDKPVGNEEEIEASFKKWFSKYSIDDVDRLTAPPSLELAYKVFKEQIDKDSLDNDLEDNIISTTNQKKAEFKEVNNTKEQKILDDIFDDNKEEEEFIPKKNNKKIKDEDDNEDKYSWLDD